MSKTNLVKTKNLLDKKGRLIEPVFAKNLAFNFNKENMKSKINLKEWDHYVIEDNNFVVVLTILNQTYLAELRATVVDLRNGFVYSKASRKVFPKDKVILTSDFRNGVSDLKTKDANFRFEIRNGERYLKGYFKDFYKTHGFVGNLEFDFKVHSEPRESVVSANKFNSGKYFIYSQKINDLDADGMFTVKDKIYTFDKDLTFANCLLARGNMPYSTKWVINSLNTKTYNGDLVAFNLGKIKGKGVTINENVVLYNGLVEKIGDIRFYIQKEGKRTNYLGSWTFYSEDGKLELCFEPLLQVKTGVNLLVLKNRTRMVLGYYSGKLTLDNGTEVEIERSLGFSEKVSNKW